MPQNLLGDPRPTRLPEDHPDIPARALAAGGASSREVAAAYPASSWAWSVLAREAMPADAVASYAFARTGYHRGLDALRRAGWRGSGHIPADHLPNRGFLSALHDLALAADAIDEPDEAARCYAFLADSGVDVTDPAVEDALGLT